ncbi:MAG: hypothetical protein AB4041_05550 [Microcystaceae cyanobacterium]
MNQSIRHLIEIIPALTGYVISGLILWYFLSQKTKWGIIMSSFFVLSSGFFFQIFLNPDTLKNFASEYKDVFSLPLFTILATVIAIFLGNSLLKYIADKKEKKEIAILFVNTIKSHLKVLKKINDILYLSVKNLEGNKKYIEIYMKQLKDNKYYETAYKKIGLFSTEEIDLVSRYSIAFDESLSDLERISVLVEKEQSEEEKQIEFSLVKSKILSILFLGYLTTCALSRYVGSNLQELNEQFFDDYHQLAESSFKEFIRYSETKHFMIADKLEDELQLIRNYYQQFIKGDHSSRYAPIYIAVTTINKKALETNIDSAIMAYLTIDDTAISVDNSKSKAINFSQRTLKLFLEQSKKYSNNEITEIMNHTTTTCMIISPWGEE